MGDTREKIAADAEKCGFTDYMFVDSFEEAVLTAAKIAKEGEAVLLSPACASWDMFPSYEVRGEKFKEIVKFLIRSERVEVFVAVRTNGTEKNVTEF